MGTTTALRQLLKSLCHDSKWKYAVFWKLNNQNHMLLTWEDGYFNNAKSTVTLESVVHSGFISGKSGIISFGSELEAQSGNTMGCHIAMAMANTSCHSYALGEGIVGKVALRRKHFWAFAAEFNSKLQPEFPEEWQLQFAAGIKTILLVPVIPLGVVQLGSLNTVMEDYTVVAHIKNLFGSNQHIGGPCISLAPKVAYIDPYTPFTMPAIGNCSAPSVITGDLPKLIHSQMSPTKYSMAPDFGQVAKNELPSVTSDLMLPINVQADLLLSQNDTDQRTGADASPCADEGTWKALCGDLLVDHTEEALTLNQVMCTNKIIGNDISNRSCLQDELDIISSVCHGLTPEEAIISNCYLQDLEHKDYDFCYVNKKMDQEFRTDYDEKKNPMVDAKCLNFPFDSELHKVLGFGSLKEQEDFIWNDILSNANESSSSAAICRTEIPGIYGSSLEEAETWLKKETKGEHLLDAVIANLCYVSDDDASGVSRCRRTCNNPSKKFLDSCITQCRTEDDISGLEDSLSWSQRMAVLASQNEGITTSPTGSSSKSIISMSSINKEEQDKDMACGTNKMGPKTSHGSKRRGKSSNFHRLRPRDRQLIQDRIKELRDLIPNGSKCSIDALLDRTVKHMLFLQSIPSQAEKLKHSTRPQVKHEAWNLSRALAHEKGASWAYELGGQSQVSPLIVENLDQPGQMLVEMECKEYGLFLEIAQVLKRLELTILKGGLESRADELWAHFIVEASSKGFHRMDILWPLMQLLQRNAIPIPTSM